MALARLLLASGAAAQEINPDIWGVDNNITGIVRSGNTIYVAGAFTHAGPNTGCGVPIDRATGKALPAFPKVAGVLNTVIGDGKGGWYVGGALVGVGGLPRTGVAHIWEDGRVDSWDPSSDGRVLALALSGRTLYVGGEFTRIGGKERSNIAALDVTTGTATEWNPGADASVLALRLTDSTLYAGGTFTRVGGQVRNSLAELRLGTGVATDWNPDAGFSGSAASVRAIAFVGDTIYVGGSFGSLGGQYRYNVGAVSARTGLATDWNPWATGYPANYYDGAPYVSTLVPGRGTMYAAGHFAQIGGQDRGGVAELDLTAGGATTWDPRVGPRFDQYAPYVTALALSDSTIYISGPFYSIAGRERYFIGEVDRRTGAPTVWDPRADAASWAMAVDDHILYAAGLFESIGDWQWRTNLAAFDAKTGKLKDWNPNPDGVIVYDLAAHADRIYVGGYFTTIGGEIRSAIAALDTTTGAALEWTADMNDLPFKLKVAGGRLYVGGAFTTVRGIPRNHLASFDLATGDLTDWNPSPDLGDVNDFAVANETVFIGGSFQFVGGLRRNHLAAVHATTGAVLDWDPEPTASVQALAVGDGVVFAGGAFKVIGGQSRNRLAALSATTGEVLPWTADVTDANPFLARVFALELAGETLFVGGNFDAIGGQARSGIAALDAASGAVFPWDPSPGAPTTDYPLQPAVIWALTAYDNTLYVGGRFRYVGSVPATTLAAILIRPPPGTVTPLPQRLALAPLAPNPISSSGSIRFALPKAEAVHLAVYDMQGRLVASLIDHAARPAGAYEVPINVANWPPGFYFCRIAAGSSTATQKFVVLK